MICPKCKARYRRADLAKAGGMLVPSNGNVAPTELVVHSSDMSDHIGETKAAFELYLSVCPCGYPLMAAVYELSLANQEADYAPVALTSGG